MDTPLQSVHQEFWRSLPTPDTACYRRDTGCANSKGVEYEQKLAGLLALRARNQGLHFEVHSNVADAWPFDDIVLSLRDPLQETQGEDSKCSPKWTTYFIQLKHSVNKKPLTLQSFMNDKNKDFLMKKYFTGFLEIRKLYRKFANNEPLEKEKHVLCKGALEDCRFVIFTTHKAWSGAQSSSDERSGIHKKAHDILCTGGQNNQALRFYETDKEVWNLLDDDKDKEIYQQEFLPLLRVYCGQCVSGGLDGPIKNALEDVFGKPLPQFDFLNLQYLSYLKKWAEEPKNNYCHTETTGEFEWLIAEYLRKHARSVCAMDALCFEEEHCINVRSALASEGALAVKVVDVPPGPRAAKVLNILNKKNSLPVKLRTFCFSKSVKKEESSWVYVDEKTLTEFPSKALEAVCAAWHCKVLVLDVHNISEKLKRFLISVADTVKVVAFGSVLANRSFNHNIEFSTLTEEWKLTQLTTAAQENILNQTLQFQGCGVELRTLESVWPGLRGEVDGTLLGALAHGKGASMGATLPPAHENESLYIARTVRHHSALLPAVLRLRSPTEHLALSGCSSRAFQRIMKALGADGGDVSAMLTCIDESHPTASMQKLFEQICQQQSPRNVHWVHCIDDAGGNLEEMVLEWRYSHGQPEALKELVQPATKVCVHQAICMHERETAVLDAATWGARTALLVGEAGTGKSSFLKMVAAAAREQALTHWTVYVPVLEHTSIFEEMFEASVVTMQHVVKLLAAAAGIKVSESRKMAAQRCLEVALLETGAITVLVDGFDELCPSLKDKMLIMLQLLLEKSKVALLWVSSRPEVEADLQRVLRCTSVSLSPLTQQEQLHYLSCWSYPSDSEREPLTEDFAMKLITALAHSFGSQGSLLEVPLHLQMVADIFSSTERSFEELQLNNTAEQYNLDLLQLFRKFIKLKRKEYQKKHGLPNVVYANLPFKISFQSLHENCAMQLLVEDRKFNGVDTQLFKDCTAENQFSLRTEKTGIMRSGEDGCPQFVHFSYVEYFAASWLFENISSNETAKAVLLILYECGIHRGVCQFLELMLTEGHKLHRALLAKDEVAFAAVLQASEPVDETDKGGRTALHIAFAQASKNAIQMLLSKGYTLTIRDTLLSFTPLQYLELYMQLPMAELILQSGADLTGLPMFAGDLDSLLQEAAMLGLPQVLQMLLDRGADVNVKNAEGETPLRFAAFYGRRSCVQILLQHGADVDAGDNESWMPLHVAGYRGNTEVMQMLLSKTMAVNVKNADSKTPLWIAAYHGQHLCADILLQHGADVDAKAIRGWAPIHGAAQNGHSEVVEVLLTHGASVNAKTDCGDTPLKVAAYHGQLLCVQILLQHGANMEDGGNNGLTPLHVAAQNGDSEVVQMLLLHRAAVDIKNADGSTPLHGAAFHGKRACAQLLLRNGADAEADDRIGWTPLHAAAHEGHLDVIVILVDARVNVNAKDSRGHTPFLLAAQKGHLNCIEFLLEHTADPKEVDNHRYSPLHAASEHGYCDIVKRILTAGVDVHSKDGDGDTALLLAATSGVKESVELLLQCGATQDRNNLGLTPLHCAAFEGHLDVMKCLLDHSCEVDTRDAGGNTALLWAVERDRVDCVKLLLRKGANPNAKNDVGVAPLHCCSDVSSVIGAVLVDAGASQEAEGQTLAYFWRYILQHTGLGHYMYRSLI